MREKKTKNIFDRILGIFSWLFFCLTVIMAVLSFFSSLSSEKNGKEIWGIKFLIVATDSMSKSIKSQDEQIFFNAGDLIFIKTDFNSLGFEEGDVISFFSLNPNSYGETLTHKIRKVNYSSSGKVVSYTTYGINTGVNDQVVVPPENIIGQYYGKIPKIGNIFAYFRTPAGYYLSILIPAVLLIMYFSVNVGNYLGKKEAVKGLDNKMDFNDILKRIELLEEKNGIVSNKNLETIADENIEN